MKYNNEKNIYITKPNCQSTKLLNNTKPLLSECEVNVSHH